MDKLTDQIIDALHDDKESLDQLKYGEIIMSGKSGKVIQIIPAPSNLLAVYEFDGKTEYNKALCLALTEDGEILIMDTDSEGTVSEAKLETGFKRFIWVRDHD
jgi:hypothetical protein